MRTLNGLTLLEPSTMTILIIPKFDMDYMKFTFANKCQFFLRTRILSAFILNKAYNYIIYIIIYSAITVKLN